MKYIHELTKLGFTQKEASVYKALLDLGEASPPIIASRTELSKSTVNEIIKSLLRKGFVTTFLKKKRKWYSPADPELLRSMVEIQSDTIGKILPELKSLYGAQSKMPTATFYDGARGLEILLQHMLDEASEIYSFSPNNKKFQAGDYFKHFDERRIKREIPFKSIFEDSPYARVRADTDAKFLRRTKIVSSKLPFGAQVFIWANKVAFVSFTDDFRVIVIQDIATTNTLRALFEIFWEN